MLHVGDDPAFDVAGARAAGLRTAWLNRTGAAWSHGPAPDLTIGDLKALATWMLARVASTARQRWRTMDARMLVDAAETESASTAARSGQGDNLDAVRALFLARKCAAGAHRTRLPAKPDASCWCSGRDGAPAAVLAGCDRRDALFGLASLPLRLPEGDYRVDSRGLDLDEAEVALGWALGSYQFDRYRKAPRKPARLVVDKAGSPATLAMAEAIYRVRTLVNTPTEDMGPAELASEVRDLAGRHGASYREWVGDATDRGKLPRRSTQSAASRSHRAPRLAGSSRTAPPTHRTSC